MRPSAPREFNWSPDDLATFAKWRRGVFILYSCVCLALIGTCAGSRGQRPVSIAGLWDERKDIEPEYRKQRFGAHSGAWS
jgi:hypothetical protein